MSPASYRTAPPRVACVSTLGAPGVVGKSAAGYPGPFEPEPRSARKSFKAARPAGRLDRPRPILKWLVSVSNMLPGTSNTPGLGTRREQNSSPGRPSLPAGLAALNDFL